jgi:periplasmic divalent cation tolerance protein
MSEAKIDPIAVVYVTTPDRTVSEHIAHHCVTEKLCACVNILPQITSVYSWKGKVESDSEELLIIKTKISKIEPLRDKVLALHPYETPEFLVLKAESVSEAYASWLYCAVAD